MEGRRKEPLKRYVLEVIMPLLKVHYVAHPLAREIEAQYRSRVQVIEHPKVGRMVHYFGVVFGCGLYLRVGRVKFTEASIEIGDELLVRHLRFGLEGLVENPDRPCGS